MAGTGRTALASLTTSSGRRRLAHDLSAVRHRLLSTVGLGDPPDRLTADAQSFWTDDSDGAWLDNSHFRSGSVFTEGDLWERVGTEHLERFRLGAAGAGHPAASGRLGRVVEWGVGGGANAVAFAPYADRFVGVDLTSRATAEAAAQVAAVCDTPFVPVVCDAREPEAVVPEIGTCDVFLCLYVIETLPSPAYGERLLRIARDLLTDGGIAFLQMKYSDGTWRSRPRGRAYAGGPSQMTTFPLHKFWQLCSDVGLRPAQATLQPRNELDVRYAYFTVVKPARSGPQHPGGQDEVQRDQES